MLQTLKSLIFQKGQCAQTQSYLFNSKILTQTPGFMLWKHNYLKGEKSLSNITEGWKHNSTFILTILLIQYICSLETIYIHYIYIIFTNPLDIDFLNCVYSYVRWWFYKFIQDNFRKKALFHPPPQYILFLIGQKTHFEQEREFYLNQ